MELEGRVAVVTGAGSGIGRASAIALAKTGVRVVVVDLNDETAESTVREINDAGGDALAVRCDVASDEQVLAVREAAIKAFGQVDIVMNNVSTLPMGYPGNIPLDAWRRAFEVNLLSMVRSLDTFLPDMLAQGSGHIVNTASTAGLYAYSYERLPYSATKAGVVGLSEALYVYCRPRGVGVTCLCPGPVHTNMGNQMQAFGDPPPVHGPALSLLEPDVVGNQVVEAIRTDRFLLLTHPEVQATLIARANDPDGFVAEQARVVAEYDASIGRAQP